VRRHLQHRPGADNRREVHATLTVLGALRRGIDAAARVMNYAGGWLYIVCALFVTLDVLGRKLVGVTSQGTTEITGYMLAFGISWSLAHALATRSHIRVDMLVARMPLGLRAPMHGLALAFLAVMAFFFVWRAWAVVLESWEFGAKDTSALSIPLIVPQGLWAFGITVFFALTVVMLLEVVVLLALRRPDVVDRMLGARTLDEETAEALEAAHMGEAARR
jgi:TRAP-type mannitol/chloroaromatic compound transport system permease small subunit